MRDDEDGRVCFVIEGTEGFGQLWKSTGRCGFGLVEQRDLRSRASARDFDPFELAAEKLALISLLM